MLADSVVLLVDDSVDFFHVSRSVIDVIFFVCLFCVCVMYSLVVGGFVLVYHHSILLYSE